MLGTQLVVISFDFCFLFLLNGNKAFPRVATKIEWEGKGVKKRASELALHKRDMGLILGTT